MANWTIDDIPDQSGKLAIVTGGTGGLGLETVLGLAGAGADVIIAGRNPAKGRDAEGVVRQRHPRAIVRFEMVDLASLASVAAFADRLLAADRPIHILVNNAGVMALPNRELTADGFEMQFGTNFLSHFALTGRLLPLLIKGNARIVQLSSIAHRSGRMQLDDLNYARSYRAWPTYTQSKLAMLMFALELDRRASANGWPITSVSAHPGVSRTDLIANGQKSGGGGLLAWFNKTSVGLMGQSAAQGALPPLMAATLPDLVGGTYYGPQGFMELRGAPGPGKIAARALDRAVPTRLWAAAEEMTGIRYG